MPPVRKLAPRHRLLPWLRRINEARRQLRDQEAMLVILSTGLGAVVGLAVSGLHMLLLAAQGLLFRLPSGGALSGLDAIPSWPYLLVPAVGGLVLGVWALLAQRIRPAEIVDPIEANALYGGKMSLWDSLRLAWLTLLSNLSGASVGMEAGYSQLGASLFSAVAQPFRLRREDKRCLTSAGAGGVRAGARILCPPKHRHHRRGGDLGHAGAARGRAAWLAVRAAAGGGAARLSAAALYRHRPAGGIDRDGDDAPCLGFRAHVPKDAAAGLGAACRRWADPWRHGADQPADPWQRP
jgi:hypothetical protein